MRNTFTGISFLLICCIASCTSLEYDQVGPRDLKNPDKRIALIGFYPFQRKVVSVQRFGNQQITNYEASIARQSPYFSAVGFGQPIDEYPVTGRQPISEERYKKLAGILVQFLIGISTLLLHVPLILGVLHQSMALLLVGIFVYSFHLVLHRRG